jgi:hypothetical protein
MKENYLNDESEIEEWIEEFLNSFWNEKKKYYLKKTLHN